METSVLLTEAEFRVYGTSHLAVTVVFAVGAWLLVRLGRRHRGTDAADRFCKAFAIAIPAFTLPMQAVSFSPARFDFAVSLPLQLCDFAWIAATYALWTRKSWAVALTYFWGLTLTTQALITPALREAFPSPIFVLFWGMHLLIVWAAIYLTWGLGLAPDWRSYRVAVLTTLAWAISTYAFNVVADTNYGFLNAKPSTASILDVLGPWPWYVAVEIAIILTAWALMTWPWVRAAQDRKAVPKNRLAS